MWIIFFHFFNFFAQAGFFAVDVQRHKSIQNVPLRIFSIFFLYKTITLKCKIDLENVIFFFVYLHKS